MNLAAAFQAECRRKVGHEHKLAHPDRAPAFEDFVAIFPPTTEGRQAAAKAAGYGTAKDHPKGSPGYVRRRTFMRTLQRYSTGGAQKRRPPERLRAREAGIVRAQWKRTSTPTSVRGVLELLNRWGSTATAVELTFSYEPRAREFDRFAVGISPATLRRSGFTSPVIRGEPIPWAQLAEAYLLAWGRAYGMGDYAAGGASDVKRLTFRVGFTDEAQYSYGPGSRPPGAPNASGNKYRGMGRAG